MSEKQERRENFETVISISRHMQNRTKKFDFNRNYFTGEKEEEDDTQCWETEINSFRLESDWKKTATERTHRKQSQVTYVKVEKSDIRIHTHTHSSCRNPERRVESQTRNEGPPTNDGMKLAMIRLSGRRQQVKRYKAFLSQTVWKQ